MGVCWPHSLERCPPTYGASPEVFKWQVGMHRWEGLSDWGWGLTWDMPGCSGLYSVLVSMCSGTRLCSLRTWRASLWSSAPTSGWSFFPSSVTKRIMVPAVQTLSLPSASHPPPHHFHLLPPLPHHFHLLPITCSPNCLRSYVVPPTTTLVRDIHKGSGRFIVSQYSAKISSGNVVSFHLFIPCL